MIAHNDVQPEAAEIVAIDLEDALAPWQTIAEAGGHRGCGRCVTASSKSLRTA